MRWVVEAIWLCTAVIAYGAYSSTIAIKGMAPVLPIVVVVRVALTNGELAGNIVGVLCGLLLDVFSLGWFGAGMLVDSLIGFGVGMVGNRIMLESPAARVIVLFVAAEAHSIGLMITQDLVGPAAVSTLETAIGTGVYTTVAGAAWWGIAAVVRNNVGWRGIWNVERD